MRAALPHNTMTEPLPNYIRRHRKLSALTQEDIAFILNLKNQDVERMEHFTKIPDAETVLGLRDVLNVPAEELFAGWYLDVRKEVQQRALARIKELKQQPKTRDTEERIRSLMRILEDD